MINRFDEITNSYRVWINESDDARKSEEIMRKWKDVSDTDLSDLSCISVYYKNQWKNGILIHSIDQFLREHKLFTNPTDVSRFYYKGQIWKNSNTIASIFRSLSGGSKVVARGRLL